MTAQAAPGVGQAFAAGMTAWEVYSFGKTAFEVYANADKIKAVLREIYDDHDIINKITCLSDEECEALADQLGEVIGSFVANMKNAREGIRKVKGIFKRLRNPKQVRETIKVHGFCFVAGTPVHTPTGLRPIENIKTGDSVLSRDEKTGKTAFRRVLRTKITPDAPVMEITLENREKKSGKFRVTAGHPFRVRNKNWVKTQDLVIGDEIFTSAGGWLRVTGSTWLSERQTVYNFEVEEFHTYFVGETGAWVHNSDKCFEENVSVDPRTLNRSHSISGKSSSKRVRKIAKDMRAKGYDGPPIDVIEHNGQKYIIDGHHRTAAAKRAGLKDVPVRVVDDLSSHPSSYNTVQEVVDDADNVGFDRLRP